MLGELAKIAGIVLIGGAIMAGIVMPFNNVSEIPVGADTNQFVGGEIYKLAGSGVNSTATSLTLTKFTVPDVGQSPVQKLVMGDFGTVGYGTIEPGTSRREFISWTGITQNADGSATLTGVSRGLAPISPYTASSTFQLAHSGGSRFIISNPPQLYNQAAFKENDESITGLWEFNDANPPQLDGTITATSSEQLVSKRYVDNVTNQGAATSTETVGGIVELATALEVASSTDLGANIPLVLQAKHATDTPDRGCAAGYAATGGAGCNVIASLTGKIKQAWLDLTEAFTWTGAHTFNGNVTLNGATTTITSATTTISSSFFGIGTTSADMLTIGTSFDGDVFISGGLGIGVATTTNGRLETSGDIFVGGTLFGLDIISTSTAKNDCGGSTNDNCTHSTSCPAGYNEVIDGGYTHADGNFTAYQNYRSASTTWTVAINNNAAVAPNPLTVYATCIR